MKEAKHARQGVNVKKPPAQKTAKTGMETPVTSLPNIGKDTAAAKRQ
jgi:hypothetical protein